MIKANHQADGQLGDKDGDSEHIDDDKDDDKQSDVHMGDNDGKTVDCFTLMRCTMMMTAPLAMTVMVMTIVGATPVKTTTKPQKHFP